VVLALLSAKERALVADIVAVMVSYGLSYTQTYEDGK
jgi:hypothetical protein